jgi:hypothetical protein
MTRNEFVRQYQGQRIFGHPDNSLYEQDERGIGNLTVNEGEITSIRPFGMLEGYQDFTVLCRRSGTGMGQILWEVL